MRYALLGRRVVEVLPSNIEGIFIVDNIRITYKKELTHYCIYLLAKYWVNMKIFIKKYFVGEL